MSFLSRLTADAQTLDAAELQSDVERCAAVPLCDLRRGLIATVTGRLRAVVYTPRETAPTLRAELFDGSAVVDLVWLGRRRVTNPPSPVSLARARPMATNSPTT